MEFPGGDGPVVGRRSLVVGRQRTSSYRVTTWPTTNGQRPTTALLLLPSPLAARPIIPNTKSLEQFQAIGLADGLLDLLMSQARANLLGQVRQFNAERGGFRDVLLQLWEVHLVVGIGNGVI